MATIGSKIIGELNVRKIIRGYQRTWKTIHPSDLSAITIKAYILMNREKIDITVVKQAYDSVTETTTVIYTIPPETTAVLALGNLSWTMEFIEDSVSTPYLHGFIEVIDL